MASIAALAIKISANIGNLTKSASDAAASIDNIAKVAGKATPSMKNLEDAAKGYGIMLDAVKQAQDRLNNSPDGMIESQTIMRKTAETAEKLKETVQNLGNGVADDILKMKPTVNNVMEAQQELEKLKAIAATTGVDLSGAIKQAEINMAAMTTRMCRGFQRATRQRSAFDSTSGGCGNCNEKNQTQTMSAYDLKIYNAQFGGCSECGSESRVKY